MPDCEEKIYSDEYVDYIISKDVIDVVGAASDCVIQIFHRILMHRFRNAMVCSTKLHWKFPGF